MAVNDKAAGKFTKNPPHYHSAIQSDHVLFEGIFFLSIYIYFHENVLVVETIILQKIQVMSREYRSASK